MPTAADSNLPKASVPLASFAGGWLCQRRQTLICRRLSVPLAHLPEAGCANGFPTRRRLTVPTATISDSPVAPAVRLDQTSLVPLHCGYLEQPQNCFPAFAPRVAARFTISALHVGHVGSGEISNIWV